MKKEKFKKIIKKAKTQAKLKYFGNELESIDNEKLLSGLRYRHIMANKQLKRWEHLSEKYKKSLKTNLLFEFGYLIELKLRNDCDEWKINDILQTYNYAMCGLESPGETFDVIEISLNLDSRFEIISKLEQ